MAGMGNPRLSFITPSILAGDRSLVSLIAHELAHSWSGSPVTNATWRDIWLNEGTTSYLEAHQARHGRMRLITPVYAALAENGEDADLAQRLFEERRGRYHPITVADIEAVLPGG